MKNSKKIPAALMTLVLCLTLAACGAPAGNAGGGTAKAEPAAEKSSDGKTEAASGKEAEETTSGSASEQTEDTVKKPNVGVIAWFTGSAYESEFIGTLQTVLSEQYSDQIGEVFIKDALMDAVMFPMLMDSMIVMWEGENAVILIVNEKNGLSDEDLLPVLETADKAGISVGVDHAVDGAPDSTFVYDASDPAGCAALIAETADNN